MDAAGARHRAFALAVLAADGVFRARGGGDVAGALSSAVDASFSRGGTRGGHSVAGADLSICDGAAWTVRSVLRVRAGGGGVPLGTLGNGGYGAHSRGAAVGRDMDSALRLGLAGASAAGSERA